MMIIQILKKIAVMISLHIHFAVVCQVPATPQSAQPLQKLPVPLSNPAPSAPQPAAPAQKPPIFQAAPTPSVPQPIATVPAPGTPLVLPPVQVPCVPQP